jgi:dynein heavy chain 1
VPLDADDEDAADIPGRRADALAADASDSANLATQVQIASILERYFACGDLVSCALTFAESIDHIMDSLRHVLCTLFSRCSTKTAQNVIEYKLQHSDFPLAPERVEQYVTKRLFVSIIWTFSGDAKLDLWTEMCDFLRKQTGIDLSLINSESSLIDFDVQITTSYWIPWQSKVPSIEIDAHAVTSLGIVVPTMDSVATKCCTLGCQSTSP